MPPRPAISDSSRIHLRRATYADLAALIALENRAFSADRMSTRQLRRHLANPAAAVVVAVRGGEIVGAAIVFFHASHRIARLYSIAVAAKARGAGIGGRLLAGAERIARKHGSAAMRLEVRRGNAAAQHLYEGRGYKRFGVRNRYYEDGGDALRYEKSLVRARRAAGMRVSPSRP